MQTYIHYPHRRPILYQTRKQLFFWTTAVILAGAIGAMIGLTIRAVDAELMQSEYRRQISDLQDEIRFYQSMPATGMRL